MKTLGEALAELLYQIEQKRKENAKKENIRPVLRK